MARTDNLSNFLTDVAGAIKEKKGSETSIPASNFDTEIRNLPSQGTYQSKSVTINTNGNTTVTPDTGYDALSQVSVTTLVPEKQLQTKSYNFTQNANIDLEPDTGYDGFSRVSLEILVPAGTDTSDATATAADMLSDKTAYAQGNKITGIIPTLRTDPLYNMTSNNVTLGQSGLKYTKTFNAQNGTYVENGNSISFSAPQNIVASTIGLTAEKIKKDETILGVTGSYEGSGVNNQNKTITPTTSQQTITADSGYTGIGTATVNAVTSAIDANIVAGNIKSGVTILGVTGTVQEGVMTQAEYNTALDTAESIYPLEVGNLYDNTSMYENSQSGGLEITSTGYRYRRTNGGGASSSVYRADDLQVNSKYTISLIPNSDNTTIGNTKLIISTSGTSWNDSTDVEHNFSSTEINTKVSVTFTATQSTMYIHTFTYGSTFGWVSCSNVMLNTGETSEPYTPYSGNIDLQTQLDNILAEKRTNVLASNIKKDVSILGVTGTYEASSGPEYVELEYIQSTGTQYIDTGLTTAQRFVGTIAFMSSSNAMEYVFGTQNNYEVIFRKDNSSNYYVRESYSSNTKEHTSALPSGLFDFDINFTNNTYEIGQDTGTFSSWVFDTSVVNRNLYLFARNNGSANDKAQLKFVNMKLYDDTDTLLADFIPVKRTRDDAICLYDKVGKTYYLNQGTGTFIAGPEVVPPYTELEYIEGTGTQWIDTDVEPSSNIKMRSKFSYARGGAYILGTQINEINAFRLFTANNQWYLDYGSGEGRNRINGNSFSVNTIYDVEVGNRYVKDLTTGNNIISGSSVSSFALSNMSIGIFASVDNHNSVASGKIYYLKIYDNNVLVRDLIPVLDSNNVVCMYDKVTEDFFYNQGTGTFVAGPTVEFVLQEKTATPTTSQQIIQPDAAYDGLSKVTISGVTSAIDNNITAGNIKSGVTILGVTGTYSGGSPIDLTSGIRFGYSDFVTLPNYIVNANWSSCTDMTYMFSDCNSITTIPLIDTSNVESMFGAFEYCSGLTSMPLIDTSSCQDMTDMFTTCLNLVTIPIFDTSNVTNMTGFVDSCESLSNQSLQNILEMLYDIDTENYEGEMTFAAIGLNETQVETCQNFSRYDDLLEAGWDTGYEEIGPIIPD